MNISRLRYALLLAVPVSFGAACTENGPAESPQTTAEATSEPAPTSEATTAPTSEPAPTATPTAEPKPTPPAPKPAKERIQGKWQFSFEGEPKAKKEEELKKKFAKEKDTKKFDAEMKTVMDQAATEWIEFADGTYTSHVGDKGKDKVVMKVKYEVAKEDGNKLTLKGAGKDEISKKDMKEEISVNLVDDNTLEMVDPKKKMTLVFKRK